MAERIPDLEMGGPCSVYVLSNGAGEPLYVGITTRGVGRMCDHSSKPWWPDVATARFEHRPTRWSAQRRELELIRSLRPVHNIHAKPRLADDGEAVEFQVFKEAA